MPEHRTTPMSLESVARFKHLLDLAADMIWIAEAETGRFREANQSVVRVLGYSREELLRTSLFDLHLDPRDRERRVAFVREALERGASTRIMTLRRKDGGPVEVEVRASPIETDEGPALLVVGRDVDTSFAEHRRALSMYEAFRRSNDVMFYCDRNGTILDVNAAFTRTYGFAREEAIGQTPRILRSRHSTNDMYQRMWSQILDPAKGFWRGQLINRTKEGREIPVTLTITAVRDAQGDVVGYVSNATDVSEQMALQGRVAHAEALAGLGEMAAVVAHEIRNPLGSIVMAAKQLTAGRLPKEDRELVYRVLRDESRRLNETLTNFLSFARPRELKLQRADLNALVDDVFRTLAGNTDLARNAKTAVSLSPAVEPFPFDPDQVRQVLWNIGLNALQAMDGEGKLTVETRREGQQAVVRIADTGPGVAPEMVAKLFKPFQTTKGQGTGLGLAIAERIAKAHGGSIGVETGPGKGTAFLVRLPAVQG